VGLKLLPLLTAGRFAWLFTLSLSFYCFQSLTYTIDLYFGEMRPTTSYLAYLASSLFFPSMTAGPIPRQGKLLDQLAKPFAFSSEDSGRAMLLISTGLVKKLLIADYLANNLVARVFDTPACIPAWRPWWRLRLRAATLLRLLRLHGYCHGCGVVAGHPVAGELSPAVPRGEPGRFLAALAHELLQLALYLPLRCAPQAAQASSALYGYAVLITFILGGLWHGSAGPSSSGRVTRLALGVVFAWKMGRKYPSRHWWAKLLGGLITSTLSASPGSSSAPARSKRAGHSAQPGRAHLVCGQPDAAAAGCAGACRGHPFIAAALVRSFGGVAARLPFWVQGLAMAALILLIQTLAGRGSAPFVYGNF